METFAIPHYRCYQSRTQFRTIVNLLKTGKEHRAACWQSPKRAWTLMFRKDPATTKAILDFYAARQGRYESFYWMDPKGKLRTVRFDHDDLQTLINYGGYGEFQITLAEVAPELLQVPKPVAAAFKRDSEARLADGTLVSAGIPRYDDGVMVEPGATNLVPYSDPTDLAQIANKSNVSIAPAGSVGAAFAGGVVFGASVDQYAYFRPALQAATTYTLSVFIRMDDGGAPVPGGNLATKDFALIAEGQLVTSYAVDSVGDGLYRVSGMRTTNDPLSGQNTGIVKYATQSARTFQVTGFDLESGSRKTSYMATSGTTATRDGEDLSIPALLLTGAFSIFITATASYNKDAIYQPLFDGRSSIGRPVCLVIRCSDSKLVVIYKDSNSAIKTSTVSSIAIPDRTIAHEYGLKVAPDNNVTVYLDGDIVLSEVLDIGTSGGSSAGFFVGRTIGGEYWDGYVKDVRVFDDLGLLLAHWTLSSTLEPELALFETPAHSVYELHQQFSTLITPPEAGFEARLNQWQTGRRAWNLMFQKDSATLGQLIRFYEYRRGQYESFNWRDPEGVMRRVRFGTDTLNLDLGWGGYGRAQVPLLEVI